MARPKRPPVLGLRNEYVINGDVATIYIHRRDKPDCELLVDASDIPLLDGTYTQRLVVTAPGKGRIYAIGMTETGKLVTVHRLLMGNPPCEVDHKNRNTLDCRRLNLRRATHGQNMQNVVARSKSGYKGVFKATCGSTFFSVIRANGKTIRVGSFPTAEQAAFAYDLLAFRLHGEFACTNFEYEEPTDHRSAA